MLHLIRKYLSKRNQLNLKRKKENIHHQDVARWLKQLKEVKTLSSEQEKEIQDFYQRLIGKRICLDSHKYFYSRTGYYSKEYVPLYLYHTDLLNKANKTKVGFLSDKNLTDVMFHGVKQPKTILKNINGYYYFEGKPVTREEALELSKNLKNVLIKPARGTHGNGVMSLEVENGITNHNEKTLETIFDEYVMDFQIQERLKQHERMSALNPTSVNTLRILTYRSGMEILVIYSVIRIGRQGQVIDNQCAGGISTKIDKEGKLGKFSFGGYNEDNILKTDSGIILDGYEVPSYHNAIDFVKQLHYRVPFFDLIGWDIAIDEVGDPVLIEWNTMPGLSQSAFGPGFGEYTERIISELWPRKNKYNNHW